MSLFKNIAIVGGAGALGRHIVDAICAEGGRFAVTIITRKGGEHKFPAGVKVVELDDYSESNALLETLVGQDVLIAAHNNAAAAEGIFLTFRSLPPSLYPHRTY
jgi:putative NADH-flavin reductase